MTNLINNMASVIGMVTNKVTSIVNVGSCPVGVAATHGNKVYVANSGSLDSPSNNVSVIDTATNKVTATVNVGKGPTAFGQFTGSMGSPQVSKAETTTVI